MKKTQENDFIFADRRENAAKNPPTCEMCKSKQVQLVDWTSNRKVLTYKCRSCGHVFYVYDWWFRRGDEKPVPTHPFP